MNRNEIRELGSNYYSLAAPETKTTTECVRKYINQLLTLAPDKPRRLEIWCGKNTKIKKQKKKIVASTSLGQCT